jgi:hypothetical protein
MPKLVTIWRWRCTSCAFWVDTKAGQAPQISYHTPHFIGGQEAVREDWMNPKKVCYGQEFLRVVKEQ